jgi:carboxynorspermidine decarboxylase
MTFCNDSETPAFVLDSGRLACNLRRFQRFAADATCRVLFSLKALGHYDVLATAASFLDGFSVSSLFEARLGRESGGDEAIVNYVSAIVRPRELEALAATCDRITFNSLSQFDRYKGHIAMQSEIGIRVNPGVSFVSDPRYDPCRRNSRLGVPLDRFRDAMGKDPSRFADVAGIHFHSNCDSSDLGQLVATIRRVELALEKHLCGFRWLNVGGGYCFGEGDSDDILAKEFNRIFQQYGLETVIEPGAGIVRSAGWFVSSVEDIVQGEEYPIAILDMSVNHWPEVFEYQFEPDVVGHVDEGQFTYLLAGCSCLAGDLFGVYSFDEPLEVGSRIVFANAGAYSIVKAHMFNGINLPNVYVLTEDGDLVLRKRFVYEDFATRCGVESRAVV